MRVLLFIIGGVLFIAASWQAVMVLAFASMVNPKLNAVEARLEILENLFSFSDPDIWTIALLSGMLLGLCLMLVSMTATLAPEDCRH